jgi:hypothetical protein
METGGEGQLVIAQSKDNTFGVQTPHYYKCHLMLHFPGKVVLTDGPVQPWLFTLAFYFSLTAESPQKQ